MHRSVGREVHSTLNQHQPQMGSDVIGSAYFYMNLLLEPFLPIENNSVICKVQGEAAPPIS